MKFLATYHFIEFTMANICAIILASYAQLLHWSLIANYSRNVMQFLKVDKTWV